MRTPEYVAWQNMRQRCMNPKFRQAADYGERGISIDASWVGRGGFAKFFASVGPRPSARHTLDRVDNERGYVPGNVRWATRTTQNRNTRKNVLLTASGVTKTLAEWSLDTGIGHSTLRARLQMGWSAEDVVQTPVRTKRQNGADGFRRRYRRRS